MLVSLTSPLWKRHNELVNAFVVQFYIRLVIGIAQQCENYPVGLGRPPKTCIRVSFRTLTSHAYSMYYFIHCIVVHKAIQFLFNKT